MTLVEITILIGLANDAAALRKERAAWRGSTQRPPPGVALAHSYLDRIGVKINLAGWLKREPSPADRKACSRALERLEQAGLVIRGSCDWTDGERMTHARLTKAGREAADKYEG